MHSGGKYDAYIDAFCNDNDRPQTFFAGHLHYYGNTNEREYITIGPAGASWQHDGLIVNYIMCVTMIDDGPQMANNALKDVFDRKGLDPVLFGAHDRKELE